MYRWFSKKSNLIKNINLWLALCIIKKPTKWQMFSYLARTEVSPVILYSLQSAVTKQAYPAAELANPKDSSSKSETISIRYMWLLRKWFMIKTSLFLQNDWALEKLLFEDMGKNETSIFMLVEGGNRRTP